MVFAVRCHTCSQARNPREVVHLPGGVVRCWQCEEQHARALHMLAGTAPVECQACTTPIADLQAMDAAGNVRLYVHLKDGVYQMLCQTCSDGYARKRRDLYGSTEYGQQIQQREA